jgi:hypothetical protein
VLERARFIKQQIVRKQRRKFFFSGSQLSPHKLKQQPGPPGRSLAFFFFSWMPAGAARRSKGDGEEHGATVVVMEER